MPADFVYLASSSPRRRELLRQIGVAFKRLEVRVDESLRPGEAASAYVARLAHEKAAAGWLRREAGSVAAVLAADTAVVLDDSILGKPKDRLDGEAMLLRLSGRSHQVLTAIALRHAGGLESRISRSVVTFRNIDTAEARRYWHSGEPCDKAGGYGVQGLGGVFVAQLSGSYSGVMGLPLFETALLLDVVGVPRWIADAPPTS